MRRILAAGPMLVLLAALAPAAYADSVGGVCGSAQEINCVREVTVDGTPTTDLVTRIDRVMNVLTGEGVTFAFSITPAQQQLGRVEVEGKLVRVKISAPDFDPVVGTLFGGKVGDLSSPNRTWGYAGGVLTVEFRPTKMAMPKPGECSVFPVVSDCGGPTGYADRVAVFPSFYVADLKNSPWSNVRDLAKGMTIATNASATGPPTPDVKTREVTIQTGGPHFLDPPWIQPQRENRGFLSMFIPADLSSSPLGFSIPPTSEGLDLVDATRTEPGADPDPVSVRKTLVGGKSSGTFGGIRLDFADFGFSSPRFVARFKKPRRVLLAKPSVSWSRNSATARVKRLPGVSYRVTASNGRTTKSGRCKTSGKVYVCTVKVPAGKWLVSITPEIRGVSGIPAKKTFSS